MTDGLLPKLEVLDVTAEFTYLDDIAVLLGFVEHRVWSGGTRLKHLHIVATDPRTWARGDGREIAVDNLEPWAEHLDLVLQTKPAPRNVTGDDFSVSFSDDEDGSEDE